MKDSSQFQRRRPQVVFVRPTAPRDPGRISALEDEQMDGNLGASPLTQQVSRHQKYQISNRSENFVQQ